MHGTALVLGVLLAAQDPGLRAGAAAVDVTPPEFPVIVNGSFLSRTASKAHDPLFARALVLDDGRTKLAIAVVDSCMMPRALLDRAKAQASASTGIRPDRMLVSATHTHAAPAAMGCLGTDPDPGYVKFLPGRIARAIEAAHRNLEPAEAGWAVVNAPEYTNCRRWILRPDQMANDPFGRRTVRAMMHPGYQNPRFVGPAGPIDPGFSLLSVRATGGRPIAVLANYSMHYFGAGAVSADYFGRFCRRLPERLGAEKTEPPFVAILSQGTSGDLHWMDYGKPRKRVSIDDYANGIVEIAAKATGSIEHLRAVPLSMAEARLSLRRRTPDKERLEWARKTVAGMKDRLPRNRPEVYAREQIYLHEDPVRELKLQALRIGELGITAIPNEVYGITGLKLKLRSPLAQTFNIELANGSEGYIPPPEQHRFGGYTAWPARTAALEEEAEPKIVETLVTLLEQVSGKPRRPVRDADGAYSRAILDSKPAAYWRLGEIRGPRAADVSGNRRDGSYEGRVAFYLPGGPVRSRAPYFAGGRMRGRADLGDAYTIELWFWNGLPTDVRPVTGYLFSRGKDRAPRAPGDHLGLGGTHGDGLAGRLLFFNGDEKNTLLPGRTPLKARTWIHVALVREGTRVRVHLNGDRKPEIEGVAAPGDPSMPPDLFIGGRNDGFAPFEGKIDEAALFDRALPPEEIARHFAAARR